MLGGGIDHLAHFGDLGRRKAADLGVLFDDVLVLREIDAERLVGRDIALDPLNIGAELAQDAVRFRRGALQLLAFEAAGAGNVALDDEFAQCHALPPTMRHAMCSKAMLGIAATVVIREVREWTTRRSGAPGSGSASPGSAAAGSANWGSAPATAK